MIVVQPDGLNTRELILDLDYFLCNSLVECHVVFPVLQKVVSHIPDILKVMKQWFQNVFVVQHKRMQLLVGHEDGVALQLLKLQFKFVLFLLRKLTGCVNDANPVEVELSFIFEVCKGRIQHSWISKARMDKKLAIFVVPLDFVRKEEACQQDGFAFIELNLWLHNQVIIPKSVGVG